MMTYQEWLSKAVSYLHQDIPPEFSSWDDSGQGELFALNDNPKVISQGLKISPLFFEYADLVLCHRSPERFVLLYRILWRLKHGEENLLKVDVDDDMRKLHRMRKSVCRDMHKMKAFVRFKKVETDSGECFVAWYEPDNYILEKVAPFFMRRFRQMPWVIVAPYASAVWDLKDLRVSYQKNDSLKIRDDYDELWKKYYASIFNPARVKIKAMKNEMPVRFWKNLPEAELIPELIAGAQERLKRMRDSS